MCACLTVQDWSILYTLWHWHKDMSLILVCVLVLQYKAEVYYIHCDTDIKTCIWFLYLCLSYSTRLRHTVYTVTLTSRHLFDSCTSACLTVQDWSILYTLWHWHKDTCLILVHLLVLQYKTEAYCIHFDTDIKTRVSFLCICLSYSTRLKHTIYTVALT